MARKSSPRKRANTPAKNVPFSEDDHVAHVTAILRQNLADDIALEEFVWSKGTKRYKDIAVKRNGLTIAVIEVKRPSKLKTPLAKLKASQQVIDYATAEGCETVAWTDGADFISKDLKTGAETPGTLIGVARGILGATPFQQPTFDRPQWTPEELRRYPSEQRKLHPQAVHSTLYIPRALPLGTLDQILSSPATLHIVYGESDVGKSTLARAVAESDAWNAIYLEAILFGADLESHIEDEIQTLYGRRSPIQAFLELVQEVSLRDLGAPFGIVIDGFDEWSHPQAPNLGELQTWLKRMEALGCKVLIFTRQSQRRYFQSPQLRGFTRESVAELRELTDEELDRFVAVTFGVKHIGGVLSGNAREICRNPGMFSMVAETYENRSGVDPNLTEPELYERYRERKAQKLVSTKRLTDTEFDVALERLALLMLEREQFSLSYDDSEKCAGSQDSLAALVEEGILLRTGLAATSPVRFRYGQFRDHALHTIAKARGVPTSALLSGIDAIRRAEGLL